MSAVIIAFPIAAVRPPVAVASISGGVLVTKFADHFLPMVQARIDLIEADDADFEYRCRRMLDAGGTLVEG